MSIELISGLMNRKLLRRVIDYRYLHSDYYYYQSERGLLDMIVN